MSYQSVIDQCKKDWDCPDLMEGSKRSRGSKIPFSSPLMNFSTYGGIPRDRITEFFGDEGCGKSTTAIDICKNAIDIFKKEHSDRIEELQKQVSSGTKALKMELEELQENGPKKVIYFDLEHSFDEQWSNTLGINSDELDIMQPPDVSGEEILNKMFQLIETNELGLIVLDSIPSLVTNAELDKKLGERTVASLAGLLTTFCRKVVPMLTKYHTTLLTINQTRENMDNPYVVKTSGGKALKFYASLRMNFRLGNPVDFLGNELPKSTESPSGYIINAVITKQKSAPNNRKMGSYFLMFDKGVVPMYDFAKLATSKYGIIKKSGAWFSMCDPNTGEIMEDDDGKLIKVNGLAKVYQYLDENPEYYKMIQTYILNDINGVDETISLSSEEADDDLFE